MANLILASKREVKSGAQMWHVYQHENGAKVAESEFYFALPYKALRYAFMLRKRTGGIIPKAIYSKLMADVQASKPQVESAPEAEQASEPSALAKAYEQMKAKHPDSLLLFRMGDFTKPMAMTQRQRAMFWASPSHVAMQRTAPNKWQVSHITHSTRTCPSWCVQVSE